MASVPSSSSDVLINLSLRGRVIDQRDLQPQFVKLRGHVYSSKPIPAIDADAVREHAAATCLDFGPGWRINRHVQAPADIERIAHVAIEPATPLIEVEATATHRIDVFPIDASFVLATAATEVAAAGIKPEALPAPSAVLVRALVGEAG